MLNFVIHKIIIDLLYIQYNLLAAGIPSSTLYKIARREGIRLAAPFNAAPTAWRRADLTRALGAIRAGDASVQRAASLFGIPTGTAYLMYLLVY